jgi:hypothetical protein
MLNDLCHIQQLLWLYGGMMKHIRVYICVYVCMYLCMYIRFARCFQEHNPGVKTRPACTWTGF